MKKEAKNMNKEKLWRRYKRNGKLMEKDGKDKKYIRGYLHIWRINACPVQCRCMCVSFCGCPSVCVCVCVRTSDSRLMGAIISMPKTLSDEESLPGDRPRPINLQRSGHLPRSEPTCSRVWAAVFAGLAACPPAVLEKKTFSELTAGVCFKMLLKVMFAHALHKLRWVY